MCCQNRLSDKTVRSLKPQNKKFKVCDGDKLWLVIFPTGVKSWRYIWKDNGKSRELTIGKFPAISLKYARQERDRINSLIAQGLDPAKEAEKLKKAAKQDCLSLMSLMWPTVKSFLSWLIFQLDSCPSDIPSEPPSQAV